MSGCSFNNSPTLQLTDQPIENDDSLASVDAAILTETLDKEFTLAQELATTWRSDTYPVAVTVSWTPTLARGRAKRVYVFGSPTDPANWWTVAINEQTSERVRSLIPKEDYLGPNINPIALKYWELNAIQALQVAEVNGGKEFRQDNPGAEVTASLSTQGPKGWLWWVVNYRGDANRSLRVRIDPAKGDVYDENGELVKADAPDPSVSPSST